MKQNINEIKRMQQLAGIINEAKMSKLDELDSKVAALYAWAGVETEYDDDVASRYDQDVINRAIELAPKILAYEEKIKQIANAIRNSDEGKMLLAIRAWKGGYSGSRGSSEDIGDLFSIYS
jgi:hypothetical protein